MRSISSEEHRQELLNEYEVCKRRGHTAEDSKIIGWKTCKYCEVRYRIEVIEDEATLPATKRIPKQFKLSGRRF